MKNNKGFSLVELIVVIAIMAILAAVAIPTFATFINKANVASDVSFINDLTYSAEIAHAASGDKISGVKVVIEGGVVKSATYTVSKQDGTEKGTVTITNSSSVTAEVENAEDYTGFVVEESEITPVIQSVDWSYKFKSEKDGTFELDSSKDNKELKDITPSNP